MCSPTTLHHTPPHRTYRRHWWRISARGWRWRPRTPRPSSSSPVGRWEHTCAHACLHVLQNVPACPVRPHTLIDRLTTDRPTDRPPIPAPNRRAAVAADQRLGKQRGAFLGRVCIAPRMYVWLTPFSNHIAPLGLSCRPGGLPQRLRAESVLRRRRRQAGVHMLSGLRGRALRHQVRDARQ